MMKLVVTATGLIASLVFSCSAPAQSVDLSVGRRLAETTCGVCHQIDAASPQSPNPDAPSFVEISRMTSMTVLAIKVFLRSSHASMPNIILTPEETDSVAAYIVSLAGK